MAYLVLARKYRPQTFDEVVGQEHITDLLKKTIQSNRLTQAYLFCGPRGIGKTSCARILAKSLNCEKGPTLKPCGKCPACTEIAKGTSFDVLEIDGASNRGIDEIRALRENVKFAPSCGRYKIYIVDEVHMLTAEAFNALLKTLEEPPEHVKFIFATTAPNKIPATIISRCQRYDFRRIPMKVLVGSLEQISKEEKLKIDQEALYAIAKAAQGGLRDAISILDQLSALSDKGIGAQDVFSMLGLVETQFLFELADALGQKDCSLCLQVMDKILDKGKDVRQLCRDITEHFRHLMIMKIGSQSTEEQLRSIGKLIDYPNALKDTLLGQCKKFTLKEILMAIDVFIEAQETARIIESVRMPLEVALAKLTYQGETAKSPSASRGEQPVRVFDEKSRGLSPASVLRDKKGQVDITGSSPQADESGKDLPNEEEDEPLGLADKNAEDLDVLAAQEFGHVDEPEETDLDLPKIRKAWDALTHGVSRERMSIATYLQSGVPYTFTDKTLTIGFPPECHFQKDTLEDKRNIEFVERVFSEKLKMPIIVKYLIVTDGNPQEEAENVKEVIDSFHGKVVNRWHEG
ncbi:MAG TPA: DNA polymerase III subunit gamma/tau [Candidatus Omnitrophota bacterium]|nr:DNA polymerase III subunit gamma/tau [Candidatus Omnitrophota bacterium]